MIIKYILHIVIEKELLINTTLYLINYIKG